MSNSKSGSHCSLHAKDVVVAESSGDQELYILMNNNAKLIWPNHYVNNAFLDTLNSLGVSGDDLSKLFMACQGSHLNVIMLVFVVEREILGFGSEDLNNAIKTGKADVEFSKLRKQLIRLYADNFFVYDALNTSE